MLDVGFLKDDFGLHDFSDPEDPQGTGDFMDNPSLLGIDGSGIVVADFVAKEKVDVLITGRLGRNALKVIQAMTY